MAENSKISWTTHTFNPWIGCAKVHAGCTNCYAEADMDTRRGRVEWGPNGTRSKTSDDYWKKPLKWNREAACLGTFDCANGDHADCCPQNNRPRVFCASLADVFEDWEGPMLDHRGQELWVHDCEPDPEPNRYVPMPLEGESALLPHERENLQNGMYRPLTMSDLRARLFKIIDQCPNIDFLLLTKRPENIRRMWPGAYWRKQPCQKHAQKFELECPSCNGKNSERIDKFRTNCWLLTSVSDQPTADAMIPHLLKCRDLTPVLGVSAEPLLGEIDFRRYLEDAYECDMCGLLALATWRPDGFGTHTQYCDKCHELDPDASSSIYGCNPLLDWIITGGESGPHARAHNIAWSRSIGQQCQAAGVSWWHKQHGSRPWDSEADCGVMGKKLWTREELANPNLTSMASDALEHCLETLTVHLKDRAGADPAEWGDGWLQQMPNTGEQS